MLMPSSPDEPDVWLSKAHLHYSHPDILARFNETGGRAGWRTRRIRSRLDGLTARELLISEAAREHTAAGHEAKADIVAKLRDGRLGAIGSPIGPSGRDPDASPRAVPQDVLSTRHCKFDMPHNAISVTGLSYADVRVLPRYEMPNYPNSLYGLSLSDCFRLVVLEDWLYHEMAEPVYQRFPSWKRSYERHPPHFLGNWPVKIEDWPGAGFTVTKIKYPIMTLGEPDPRPPDAVIGVRRRVDDQTGLLIRWLRDGILPAEGIKEPKEDDPHHIPIPASWWSPADVEVDFRKSSLWVQTRSSKEMKFSEIRIVPPKADAEEPDQAPLEEQKTRPKGKRGRKPKWDWKAATREMMRLANSGEGLPRPQSEIERYFANWFSENYDKEPSESAIRNFVSERLPPDYHPEN